MASSTQSGSLADFVKSQGLGEGTGGDLPDEGGLLGRSGLAVNGAGNGKLQGGRTGTVFHCTYETHSDDHTTTHHKTAVVIRVPEGMGYAPYLMMGSSIGLAVSGADSRAFEPAEGVSIMADKGIDEGWLTELFSPAFSEWLQRSPDDFGAEYLSGVLTVARESHLSDQHVLTSLCTDAAKIADAIRDEAVEEVEAGGGAVAKAAAPSGETAIAARLVPTLGADGPPAHVESTLAAGRHLAVRTPAVWGSVVKSTLLWMLGVNIIGGGIYGLLLNLSNVKMAVLIYQLILLAIIGPLVFRSKISRVAKTGSEEAFYAGYAKSHDLTAVQPLKFAAEYAEANLPGKPVRVFEGLFGGTEGHLMLTGAGRERGDQIALVRGPKGPTATTELNVSAPGVSAKALDDFVATLVLDLETQPGATAQPTPD